MPTMTKKKSPSLAKVVVSKRKWLRGGGSLYSGLLMSGGGSLNSGLLVSGNMCCLGFACLQATNATELDLRNVREPSGIPDLVRNSKLKKLVDSNGGNTTICIKLMKLNDNPQIDDDSRMKALKKMGVRAGIKFMFVS